MSEKKQKQVKTNPEVSNLLDTVNGLPEEEVRKILGLTLNAINSRTIVKETTVEEDGTVYVNSVVYNEVPKELQPVKKEMDLVSIVERIFVEKSLSRQVRYQLYVDKDKRVRRPDFDRACHTLAFLGELKNHDTEIEITDDFNEVAIYKPTDYKVPGGLLYKTINFSNRVYINEKAKAQRKWCSQTTVTAGYDRNKLMRPDELETFLNNFNSEAKEDKKWEAVNLTKAAVAYSTVAGGLYPDEQFVNKLKFVEMHDVTDGVTEAVVRLRGITFKGFEEYGTVIVPKTINEYIKADINGN